MALEFSNKGTEKIAPIPKELKDDEFLATAWGFKEFGGKFEKLSVPRPKIGDDQVKLEMMYCGICHTDVHMGLNDFTGAMYPMVTGHELVGIICEVGKNVKKLKVGDKGAVGCIIDSCFKCNMCQNGDENYCKSGFTHTYNSVKTKGGHIGGNINTQNFGGYTDFHTVHHRFCYKLPHDMPIDKAAPVLCAGITMWDPLRQWGATSGDKKLKIGIAGVGGLGTMGIKLSAALGHETVAISSSYRKQDLAMKKGASGFVAMSDSDSVDSYQSKLDLILDTIPAHHDINPLIKMLTTRGVLVFLGVSAVPCTVVPMDLLFHKKIITGSLIGGVTSTKECIEFCYKNNIYPDIEVITADELTETWIKLLKSNAAGLRYVLDIKKSLK